MLRKILLPYLAEPSCIYSFSTVSSLHPFSFLMTFTLVRYKIHPCHVYIIIYMHVYLHTHTADSHKVYATVVDKQDHLYHLGGGEYNDREFETYPDRYGSIFAEKVGGEGRGGEGGVCDSNRASLIKQNIATHHKSPKEVFFLEKNGLPQVGFELTMLCSLRWVLCH